MYISESDRQLKIETKRESIEFWSTRSRRKGPYWIAQTGVFGARRKLTPGSYERAWMASIIKGAGESGEIEANPLGVSLGQKSGYPTKTTLFIECKCAALYRCNVKFVLRTKLHLWYRFVIVEDLWGREKRERRETRQGQDPSAKRGHVRGRLLQGSASRPGPLRAEKWCEIRRRVAPGIEIWAGHFLVPRREPIRRYRFRSPKIEENTMDARSIDRYSH